MIEILALPDWNTPPRTLADWSAQFAELGHASTVVRDDDGDTWIEVAAMRLRGIVELDGDRAESIYFELHDPDPTPATTLLESAARALGWEIYPEDEIEDSSEI
jgi:hypothetical protein